MTFDQAQQTAPTMSQYGNAPDCLAAREHHFFLAGIEEGRRQGLEKAETLYQTHAGVTAQDIICAIRAEGGKVKTAKEKIEEFCKENGLSVTSIEFSLLRLLKEQDRDTRHACAEAIMTLQREPWNGKSIISVDEAHAACMNVKAV